MMKQLKETNQTTDTDPIDRNLELNNEDKHLKSNQIKM